MPLKKYVKRTVKKAVKKTVAKKPVSRRAVRFWWHYHHNHLLEKHTMREVENRRVHIKGWKNHKKLRLKWFTPVAGKIPAGFKKTMESGYSAPPDPIMKKLLALHTKEHPSCPWTPGSSNPFYGKLF